MDKLTFIESNRFDPYRNQAVEEALMFCCEPGERMLYLWQNQRTVVIGRNQNAWKECRVNMLETEGGRLARRNSGGGAVYHDLGNLNFTFIARDGFYDVDRQLAVIRQALNVFGIKAEQSGRNDIVAQGKKVSGNAFYEHGDFRCHHGTLMLNTDVAQMTRYLTVSREKMAFKGIDSIRSRVGNLCEMAPGLSLERLKEALRGAFDREFNGESREFAEGRLDASDLKKREMRFASWDWIYGRQIPFQHEMKRRFLWGELTLQLEVECGRIKDAAVYSDTLVWTLLERMRDCLVGSRYEKNELCDRVAQCPVTGDSEEAVKADILNWFGTAEF